MIYSTVLQPTNLERVVIAAVKGVVDTAVCACPDVATLSALRVALCDRRGGEREPKQPRNIGVDEKCLGLAAKKECKQDQGPDQPGRVNVPRYQTDRAPERDGEKQHGNCKPHEPQLQSDVQEHVMSMGRCPAQFSPDAVPLRAVDPPECLAVTHNRAFCY